MIPVTHVLVFSMILFGIGVTGVLIRRNALIMLMSLELMMNAANINLIVFARQLDLLAGQVFAIFVMCVAASEVAIGLAIIAALFKNKGTVQIDHFNGLKG
ncbi:MAG: NADH-quinone oxidoreductase subunit NuoK [Acidobacteria bacterium]|nr:NADH-quinone oxidoreductase subunit NuoK [Acidobacteriota bacterium]